MNVEQQEKRGEITLPSEKAMKQYFEFIINSRIPERVAAAEESLRKGKTTDG